MTHIRVGFRGYGTRPDDSLCVSSHQVALANLRSTEPDPIFRVPYFERRCVPLRVIR
jgi:hypothetical protein